MNLFRSTGEFLCWIVRVMRVFVRLRPFTTLGLVVSSLVERVTSLLSFLLPLKVILLAGSDGVPRYFRFFIDPADKGEWVVILAAAAVVCYVLSLASEAVSARLADSGSKDVLQRTNEMATLGHHREQARDRYQDLTGICAAAVFVIGGAAVLAVINPELLGFLSALIVIQYLFSAFAVRTVLYPAPDVLGRMLRDNLTRYMSVLSSITFLAGFFFILDPFVRGGDGNLLFAIIAVVMLRRVLGAGSEIVRTGVALSKRRHVIDALVFRDQQLISKERRARRAFRDLFGKHRREARVASEFRAVGKDGPVEVNWLDHPFRRSGTFLVRRPDAVGGTLERYEQQVYSKKLAVALQKEDYLFSCLPRHALHAPPVVRRFKEGDFECQLCACGDPVSAACWPAAERYLYQRLWTVSPPSRLLNAFQSSRPVLGDRLTPDFLGRMAVALDTSADAQTFQRIQHILPALRALLRGMPLYVHNPDLVAANVTVLDDSDYYIMSWGRWSLEPIGFTLPGALDDAELSRIASTLSMDREDIGSDGYTSEHMRLARYCGMLERRIIKQMYKSALTICERVLESPLLTQGELTQTRVTHG